MGERGGIGGRVRGWRSEGMEEWEGGDGTGGGLTQVCL